jgi:adenylate cyclase
MLKFYKHNIIPVTISLILFALSSLLYLEKIPIGQVLLQRLNAISYDLRIRATTNNTPSGFPPIYIIDIDEASLEQEGRWPWSRIKLASLVNALHRAGAAVITLDITLTEAERNPVDLVSQALAKNKPELLSTLNNIRKQLDADQQLAMALKDKNVILGYFFKQNSSFSKGWIKPTLVQSNTPINQLSSLNMQGYGANLALFSQSASQNGFFTVQPNNDGIVRKAALVLEYKQQLYTSLAVETAKLYLGADKEAIILQSKKIANVQTITHIIIAGQKIRTDANGRILIPYLGKAKTFTYISASDVLQHKKIPDLTDSIVIIGTSAQTLADMKTTPLQASYPGVEIQATLIHALLNPELIPYSPEWKDGAAIVLLCVLSLIMMLLFPLLRPLSLIIFSFSLVGVVIAFNLWLWIIVRINLDIILPVLLIMVTSTIFILHRLIREHNQRQRIHSMFGQYVPEEHIERLLEDNKAANMDGEQRKMSVLFSDIRNFTAISEGLSTQQLKQFLNHYLTPITEIIFKQQGTIDKYIGDLVMAFWGAPLNDPQHAENAVLAALEMRHKTATMQNKFQALGVTQTVKAGIGIHTGTMNVGDMGSTYRRAYTVLGDAVNLGSRLESLTKQYDILILVSEDTMQQCPSISFRLVDYVRVKGRQEAVQIYEPLCLNTELTSEQKRQIAAHNNALNEYLIGNWQQAYKQFTRLSEQYKDPLHKIYLQRMQQMDLIAPNDWDGIFTHTRK